LCEGGCRDTEVLVPFDLMHLGLGADVQNIPQWLAKSVLATQLSQACEFEHLLTVLACTAASCFLQAGVLRHATYLASLAANYLFRAVRFPSPITKAGRTRCINVGLLLFIEIFGYIIIIFIIIILVEVVVGLYICPVNYILRLVPYLPCVLGLDV
jgi:hypothetical protein